jgi:hypothetical protein
MTVIQRDAVDLYKRPSVDAVDTNKPALSSRVGGAPPLLDVPLDIAFEVLESLTLEITPELIALMHRSSVSFCPSIYFSWLGRVGLSVRT